MPPLITSSTLDPNFIQLVNLIAGSMVTNPNGNTPVAATSVFGAVKLLAVDCTALSVSMQLAPGGVAQVSIGYPGSQFNVVGYLNSSMLSALMNQLPVYTTSALPAANLYPPGYAVFNSTTQRILVSNGTAWVGGLNQAQLSNPSGIGPAVSLSFNGPSVEKTGSGVFAVRGSIAGSVSPQQTVTINLYRDGTGGTLLASQSISPGGENPVEFFGDLSWLDTMPDANMHYYTVQAVGAGGADISIPIDGASIQVTEL